MKSVKTIFILAVAALLVTGPAVAGGKDYDKGKGRAKHKSPPVSHALLLYPDASSGTALTKHYRDDPLYQKKDSNPFYNSGYVIDAGPFILDIYNQGSGHRDETTAQDVQLVVAINDLTLFKSALINGYELTPESFSKTPETPRFYSDNAFPQHGVFPAYYAEIPVGNIAPGELAAVAVDIKGDPNNLLIHFDAYGRGSHAPCDDNCRGHKGKKGHGKKDDCHGKGEHHKDCCDKDRHGRHHDWEKCAQDFDIGNKLSRDVTQVGGGMPSTLSVTFDEANPGQVTQLGTAVFRFHVEKTDTPPQFTVTAFIEDPDEEPAIGGVLSFTGTNKRSFSVNDGTVLWNHNQGNDFVLAVTASETATTGQYSLEVCAEDISNPDNKACSTFKFEVIPLGE